MKSHKISATQIILPKGGGAIQSIGETFQADEFTGGATLSIPIPTSPCRGFEPQLSIGYSSGSGNGIFGLGFDLSLPNISRKTSKGRPRYDESDTVLLSNAEDLVPVIDGERNTYLNDVQYRVVAYRPRTEGLFAKIEHWIDLARGDSHWRVVSKDNITSLFGQKQDSRISDPEDSGRVFQWLLSETFDAKGNRIIYEYEPENEDGISGALYEVNRLQTANKYIKRIRYGNAQPLQEGQQAPGQWHYEVVFDYGEYDIDPANPTPYTPVRNWANRKDPFSIYNAGFEIRTHRLCHHILMFHRFEAEFGPDPILVHATRFHYEETLALTLLKAVESIGYGYRQGEIYETKSLPPLDFEYTTYQPGGHSFEPLLEVGGHFMPGLDLSPDYMFIDLYGESIPGILYSDGRTTLYWEPKGDGIYALPQKLTALPIEANVEGMKQRLMDITGNAQLDLVVSTPTSNGYYEANPDRTWKNFKAFPAFPTDFHNPENYLVDVTGDGLADILLIGDERALVYPSLGEKGFGTALIRNRENDMPFPRRGAANEVLQFADMFGTGGQHLVRITNGMVECWPNLGYGRFGKKVMFSNPPRFQPDLDASRLFLADLDGSGTADLIYAYPDRVEIYFNRSGNSFSEAPLVIDLPRKFDRLDQIEFADVYGNGTSCLLFSETHPEPLHWVYDFCQKQKPYLLNEIDNNLGAKSTITYCSSTKFYLDDKKSGIPWIVNLPFPVQVVQKTETIDLISQTRLIRTYAYHHGHYDGVEREFRGFGMVERQDAETLKTGAKPYDVPPVLTKTWYHTGAWLEGIISRQYEIEYFKNDPQAHPLPDSVFDFNGLQPDAETWREAVRALKGTVLREEVFAPSAPTTFPDQDNDAAYIVTEMNYCVKLLQPKGQNKHCVYFVHPQETLTYDYERNTTDPRADHMFVLKVDEYGNILRSCSVTYGRRQMTGEELPEQLSIKAKCEENTFVTLERIENDAYLPAIPHENKEYEIKNLSWTNGHYFSFEEISTSVEQALLASCSNESDRLCARLLSWQRHYYWGSDNTQVPSLNSKVCPQELLYRTEEAVFSREKIENVFDKENATNTLEDMLENDGGYLLDFDYWWNPELCESYYDASQFFLPMATTDPFDNSTRYEYDKYHLLLTKITDALNNQTSVQEINYQALQPRQIRDINGNVSEVLFDPLGMVVVTSHYGTENDQPVGFMCLDDYQMRSPPDMWQLIADPQTYLQDAASYFYYDLFSWKERKIPVHTVSLTQENYPAGEAGPVQIHVTYNDGFGQELHVKQKVEPGEAFYIDEEGDVKTKKTDDRWLTSGRKIYNNKGNLVKQYEPYYFAGYDYINNSFLNKFGVSPTLYYDPLQRLIRVDTPKGFFSKVVFSAWEERHYDENDTVKDSEYYKKHINDPECDFWERQALQKASLFYETPEEKVLDNLGRTVQDVQNKEDGTRLITRYEWDIQGNNISSSDPRLYSSGKKNFRLTYSMTHEVLKTVSADGGTHWQFHNAVGNLIYARDSRNFEMSTQYDALHRPRSVHVRGGDGAESLDQIAERMIYGDSQDEGGNPVVKDPEKLNLRGEMYVHYDQAGMVRFDAYNILGQLLEISRRLSSDYKQEANWGDISEDTLSRLLLPEVYATRYQYDALGRVASVTNHDGNLYVPTYHLSGRLKQVQVDGEEYVKSIEYDPKGQRQRIVYGNGIATSYEYESTTFRLMRIKTARSALFVDSDELQDLSYCYDPVGNVTHIADDAKMPIFGAYQQIKPESDYTYDALYRLIEATGRESPAQSPRENERRGDFDENWFIPLPQTNGEHLLQKYSRWFSYDNAGNLNQIRHSAEDGATSWEQDLTVSDGSNRAVERELTDNPEEVNQFFDLNGNQTRTVGLKAVSWNYRDNIAGVTTIERKDSSSDLEYYVYDGAGNRVRKVAEEAGNGGKVTDTIYLGTLEIECVTRGEDVIEERHSLRVMDDQRCIAVRLNWEHGGPEGIADPQVRYQLDNHLGSCMMEVDLEGYIISYEEYFPYGGTALIAGRSFSEVELKKYRYSGKERSCATGLYYYGARYYAPWLGRWMSPDPAGAVDGLNLYSFVLGNPLAYVDIGGLNGGLPSNLSKAVKRSSVLRKRKREGITSVYLPIPRKEFVIDIPLPKKRKYGKVEEESIKNIETQGLKVFRRIEKAKIEGKRQALSHRTEIVGEIAAFLHMKKQGKWKPAFPVAPGHGTGFDQLWYEPSSKGGVESFMIVEAKGPGAKLAKSPFLKTPQMSKKWIDTRAEQLARSKDKEKKKWGVQVAKALREGKPKVFSRVLTAKWNRESQLSAKGSRISRHN